MCTVSIVPYGRAHHRLICNRDEQRTRGSAQPPAWYAAGTRTALFPRDADEGGTWVGLNDHGLVAVLLNRTDDASTRAVARGVGYRTRGAIVPQVLAAADVARARALAVQIPRESFRPFRLVLLQGLDVVVVSASAGDLHETRSRLSEPLMLTSSSLGDRLVDPPRRALFNRLMRTERSQWLPRQQRFHAWAWPGRPELGVLMSRSDARTVSRTICDIGPDTWTMTYEPIPARDEGDRTVSAEHGRSHRHQTR